MNTFKNYLIALLTGLLVLTITAQPSTGASNSTKNIEYDRCLAFYTQGAVENLTADNPHVLTYSVHQSGIFPGTGEESQVGRFYNHPLQAGAGDVELIKAINDFTYMIGARERIYNWQPDLIFITCGADGHEEDPLTGLAYSTEGYVSLAQMVRERFPNLPILLGGAGGYLPDTRTPEVWANVAVSLAKQNR